MEEERTRLYKDCGEKNKHERKKEKRASLSTIRQSRERWTEDFTKEERGRAFYYGSCDTRLIDNVRLGDEK